MKEENTSSPDPRDILKHLEVRPNVDGEDEPPSLRTIIRETTEEDMPITKNITLKKILGGDILSADVIRKQIWLVLLISLFIVVYISNRYKCQQNLIRISQLTEQLKDAKYRALSSSSDLTQQTRESMVLEKLRGEKDSTLHIATQPPYIINVSNSEKE